MSDTMLKSAICDLRPAPVGAVSQVNPEYIQFITRAGPYKQDSGLVINPTPLGT